MSFNEFLQQRFEGIEGTDELRDITRHGLSGGVSGFIYYNELVDLFTKYEDEILDYCIQDCGVTLSDLAVDCVSIAEIALHAVWMFVEGWAHTEYENRMTTLEELNDENLNDLIQSSAHIRHPELSYAN
jgi:hypothetical protein